MINILAVCTGNICRSPMAAALLRVGAKVTGLEARVASAGTIPGGQPADPQAVAAMRDRGIALDKHRSHQMAEIDIEASHLVLAMAGEHVIEVVAMVPEALPKAYTIREFVQRARQAGPCPPGVDPADYVQSLHSDDRYRALMRLDPDDDIADPLGQGRRAFQRTAEELDVLVWATVDLLAGYTPGNR